MVNVDDMTEGEFLHWALCGETEAVAFCDMIFRQSQLFDDLVDRDKEYSNAQVYSVMFQVWVDLPRNEFFRLFNRELSSFLTSALLDWEAANEIEERVHSADELELMVAYVIRDTLSNLVTLCAVLIAGHGWGAEIAPIVRRRLHDERFALYLEDLRKVHHE